VPAEDRRRLLDVISRHAEDVLARTIGPVDEVFAANPWLDLGAVRRNRRALRNGVR
jgi:hypothetical protein